MPLQANTINNHVGRFNYSWGALRYNGIFTTCSWQMKGGGPGCNTTIACSCSPSTAIPLGIIVLAYDIAFYCACLILFNILKYFKSFLK